MSAADRVTIERAFDLYDIDDSGSIDRNELRALCSQLGAELSDSDLRDAIDSLDTDGSGNIEKNEFTSWWLGGGAGGGDEDGIEATLRRVAQAGKRAHFIDIHIAAWRGEVEVIDVFLEKDRNLARLRDTTDFGEGNHPLHYAAYQGHVRACQALLKGGAELNARNDTSCTPLFYASQQGHIAVVKLLLGKGARVKVAETEHHFTPLHVCKNDKVFKVFQHHAAKDKAPAKPDPPIFKHMTKTGAVFVDWDPLVAPQLPVKSWNLVISELPADGGDDAELLAVGEMPTSGDITEAMVEGLASGVTYVAQVSATNAMGAGTLSDRSQPFTIRKAPSRPSQLTAEVVLPESVTFSWRKSHARGAPLVRYVVQVRPENSKEETFETVAKLDGDTTTATVPMLFSGPILLRVYSVNEVGRSKMSDILRVVVPKSRDFGHSATVKTVKRKRRPASSRSRASARGRDDVAEAAEGKGVDEAEEPSPPAGASAPKPRRKRRPASAKAAAKRPAAGADDAPAGTGDDADTGAGGAPASKAARRRKRPASAKPKPKRKAAAAKVSPGAGAGGGEPAAKPVVPPLALRPRRPRASKKASSGKARRAAKKKPKEKDPVGNLSGWDADTPVAASPMLSSGVGAAAGSDDAGFHVNRLTGTERDRLAAAASGFSGL